MFIICNLCLATSSSYATESRSVINELYPDEVDMNMDTNIELMYRQVPPENYRWDTNLKFVEWSGILPEFKNPADVTDNTTASGIFKTSVQFVRFAVFLVNLGFSMNVLTISLEKVEGKLEVLSNRFFQEVFPITSTLLVIFMLIAWWQGRKGHMVKLLLVALITSTVLIGGAKHIGTLAKMTSGVIDDISRSIIGMLNIDGESPSVVGAERVARTNNIIWQVAVDEPWTAGQFGSQTPPTVTYEERKALDKKNVIVNDGENWKDLFLKYRPGTRERAALVEVLADEDILHASDEASAMMGELAISVRMMIAIISLFMSIAILALFIIVAGLMIVSGILLLAGMIALPFIAPLPFLGDIGMRWVKNYLGFMIGAALLKISSTLYMSIVMILIYIVSLFDNWHFLVVMGVMLIVVSVAAILSPYIWRRMAPAIARLASPGEMLARRGYNQLRKLAPENTEKLFERYGAQKIAKREQRSIEDEMERRRTPLRSVDEELRTLQNIKNQDAAQYVASGLDKREKQLNEQKFKAELANTSLPNLQSQRQQYENRLATGESLSDQEQRELKMIQDAERNSIRNTLRPSDRTTFDQLSYKHKNNFEELKNLQQQKINDPMEHVAKGGEAKMSYLEQQQQQIELRERELLKANTVPENESNKDLRKFLRSQGNESVLTNHANNIAPKIDEGRQLFIESMNHEERQAEQQIYETKLANNEQFSSEEQNDFFYLQHNDWRETISSIDSKEYQQELQAYHTKETSYESQLRQLSHARENEPDDFLKMGGAVKQEEIQQNLYGVREQTQEVLRNTGHREVAEKHLKMAEQRDKMLNIVDSSSTAPHIKVIEKKKDERLNTKDENKPLTQADIIRRAREQREKEKQISKKRQ